MKVMFIGIGQTHYYSFVLDKIKNTLGYEVSNVVAETGGGAAGAAVFQSHQLGTYRKIYLKEGHLSSFVRFFWGLSCALLKVRPDCVIVTEEYLYSLLANPVVFVLRKMGMKIFLKSIPFRLPLQVELKNRSDLKSRLKLLLNSYSYRSVDGHFNYVDAAVSVFGSYGVPKEKIYVTRNSPDTDMLFRIRSEITSKETLRPRNATKFIHVGRLIPWKRVDLLLKAFTVLKKEFPNIELGIVGDGPENENLHRFVHELEVENVKFFGAVHDYKLLGKILLEHDIYVLAGMGGLSLNDAMAFGLPIICSVCDGTEKALVKDGVNGLYFNDGDLNDLVAKMRAMVLAPERTQMMGLNSEKIIRNEVNIHTVISAYRRGIEAES